MIITAITAVFTLFYLIASLLYYPDYPLCEWHPIGLRTDRVSASEAPAVGLLFTHRFIVVLVLSRRRPNFYFAREHQH
jgi:hypothetical protein